MGSRELIPHFVSLACAAFALPVKLSLPQPESFLTFTVLTLHMPQEGSEQTASYVVLGCRPG